MKYDRHIGMYLYRIVTWEDYPRQEKEFTIIKRYDDIDCYSDFEDVKGFNKLEDAINFINKLKATRR